MVKELSDPVSSLPETPVFPASLPHDRPVRRLTSHGAGPVVAFVSSYVPRECGIATFTRDLHTGLDQVRHGQQSLIVAINDPGAEYAYARRVIFQIDQSDPDSYVEAARYLNRSRVQVVSLQHEFGLYGIIRAARILAEDYGRAKGVRGGPFIIPPKLHPPPLGVPGVEIPRRSYNFKR